MLLIPFAMVASAFVLGVVVGVAGTLGWVNVRTRVILQNVRQQQVTVPVAARTAEFRVVLRRSPAGGAPSVHVAGVEVGHLGAAETEEGLRALAGAAIEREGGNATALRGVVDVGPGVPVTEVTRVIDLLIEAGVVDVEFDGTPR